MKYGKKTQTKTKNTTYQDVSGRIPMYQDVSGMIFGQKKKQIIWIENPKKTKNTTYQDVSGRISMYQDVSGEIFG